MFFIEMGVSCWHRCSFDRSEAEDFFLAWKEREVKIEVLGAGIIRRTQSFSSQGEANLR